VKDIELVDVSSVEPLEDYRVRLIFADGLERTVDLEPYLRGPIFEAVREPDYFRSLQVDSELGTITWPNGADIDPVVLRHDVVPAWRDDEMPVAALRSGPSGSRRGARSAHFVLSRASSGKYRFRLVAGNGKVIATSSTYKNKASAIRAIQSVKQVGVDAAIVEQDS
jgi:uncharacterized protein YegP (UPF0339 family)